jgi:dihydroorotate dehydrogenase subfamily 1
MAHSPSEMAYIAKSVYKAGADAIELGLSIPHGEGVAVMGSDPDHLYNSVRRVIQSVDIPVMVKFSPHVTNISELAKVVEKAGASGISAIDTVRSIIGVDLETSKPLLATYGGYSGVPIKPIGLATVASIAQSVKIPVCGIGGISTWNDSLEYMMLGASTVQIGSAIMTNGPEVISEVIAGMNTWLEEKQLRAENIVGKALVNLKSFDEIEIFPYKAVLNGICSDSTCKSCVVGCLVGALEKKGGNIVYHQELCNGCGLCVSLCKDQKFELKWRL